MESWIKTSKINYNENKDRLPKFIPNVHYRILA